MLEEIPVERDGSGLKASEISTFTETGSLSEDEISSSSGVKTPKNEIAKDSRGFKLYYDDLEENNEEEINKLIEKSFSNLF